jgi:hypothetical protein
MVEKGKDEEEIRSKSQVIVDGDVSDKRVGALVKLQREEEALDYKEALDLGSNVSKKRARIDLVCDIVSMANTRGGYILVGVKENEAGDFSVGGVGQDCIALLGQETVQNWLGNYVDATVGVITRAAKYERQDIVAICVLGNRVPIPFRQHGQYRTRDGSNHTKFCAGDLFVRHGAKSEKANYEDWLRIADRIRHDERANINPEAGITSRLDTIIQLLGGAPPTTRVVDLSAGSEEDVEDQVFQLVKVENTLLIKRALRKEFRTILEFLQRLEQSASIEEFREELDRTFVTFLRRLFPVWVTAVDCESIDLARRLVHEAHSLYVGTNNLRFRRQREVDSLWVQSRIIYVIYGFGAFAVSRDKPEYARLAVEKRNGFDEYYKDRSWFRYILTMLSRGGRLENKSLLAVALGFLKDNAYLAGQFEDEEKLTSYLCQFDFLQCAYALAQDDTRAACYPSFGAYYKKRTVPIVSKIIETCESGLWLQRVDKPRLAKIIDDLDRYAAKEFGFWFDWDYGQWGADVGRFLEEYAPKETGE